MSEGSYEKDGGSSEDHESFGSAKGSRSSGNSSLSPHNSMEGSPRMHSVRFSLIFLRFEFLRKTAKCL